MNLYICLHDGFWLFYEPIVQKFLDSLDTPPPHCPECKGDMHCVTGLERLQLMWPLKSLQLPEPEKRE